ncbi:MAG: hypothetical protein K5673_03480 [Lachnospiraceae bacterium]|nr:hypothetical protein [Lachnospiraceae bacterium]
MANQRDSGDLIRQLATSFGMADTYNTRLEGSKYDAATGTLYCDGMAVSKSSVETALAFFQRQRDYFRSMADMDNAAMEQFLNYSVAYNAIAMMMTQKEE